MKVFAGRHPTLHCGLVAVLVLFWPGRAALQGQDAEPNPKGKPTFGSVALKAGFLPDPFRKDLIAGGKIRTKLGGVSAWVAENPDFILDYQAGNYPLTIYIDSNSDTTLLVKLPGANGKWVADDDSGGNLNPLLKFDSPASGSYAIWVGSFKQDYPRATLHVTEFPSPPRDRTPQEKEILFSVSERQLDKILTDMKIPHEEDTKGVIRWGRGPYPVTLERFDDGKGIVIGVDLTDQTEATLEQVNKWNGSPKARLNRAWLRLEQGRRYPRLESSLNCELGVTPKGIDQFIRRFYQSLDDFKSAITPPGDKSSRGRSDQRQTPRDAGVRAGIARPLGQDGGVTAYRTLAILPDNLD